MLDKAFAEVLPYCIEGENSFREVKVQGHIGRGGAEIRTGYLILVPVLLNITHVISSALLVWREDLKHRG